MAVLMVAMAGFMLQNWIIRNPNFHPYTDRNSTGDSHRFRVSSLSSLFPIPGSLTMMPPEVMAEILSRLPVKSILRFRSVSKPMCALIDSPYFVKLHRNQSMRTYKLLTDISSSSSSVPANSFYSVNLDSGASATTVRMDTPFDRLGLYHVIGSCNELICLFRKSFNRDILFWNILIWNPSTKKYKMIQEPLPSSKGTLSTYRFGYDHVNDDYKVVRFSQSIGSGSNMADSEVTVYSLKSNVWQSVGKDLPYHICLMRGYGVFCNCLNSHDVSVCGAIHLVVTQNPHSDINCLIVAFDLHMQSFKLMPQPENSEKYGAIDLGILGGCLCVVGNHKHGVDVWVMAKYGVKESWSKLIVMPLPHPMMEACSWVKPLGYLKNGKEVLLELDNQWFVWYNLEKKTSKMTKIRSFSFLPTLVYHEGLV